MNDERISEEARRPCIVYRINGTWLYIFMLLCPFVAFLVAILGGVFKDFESSTATACHVWNLLPSISAAISCCTPQMYIWRLLVAVHSAPRFMVAFMYYQHYMAFRITGSRNLYESLVALNSGLHILENFCLLMLSFVMSHEHYATHERSFIGFMMCSESYMLLTLFVFRWSRSAGPWIESDQKSYRYKVILFTINISAFLVSLYFFFRHNWYCEPGMYSVFAFLEYVVVLTNIAFHGTAIFEFGQGELVFSEVCVNKLKHR